MLVLDSDMEESSYVYRCLDFDPQSKDRVNRECLAVYFEKYLLGRDALLLTKDDIIDNLYDTAMYPDMADDESYIVDYLLVAIVSAVNERARLHLVYETIEVVPFGYVLGFSVKAGGVVREGVGNAQAVAG